jgi:hypothetical protein
MALAVGLPTQPGRAPARRQTRKLRQQYPAPATGAGLLHRSGQHPPAEHLRPNKLVRHVELHPAVSTAACSTAAMATLHSRAKLSLPTLARGERRSRCVFMRSDTPVSPTATNGLAYIVGSITLTARPGRSSGGDTPRRWELDRFAGGCRGCDQLGATAAEIAAVRFA